MPAPLRMPGGRLPSPARAWAGPRRASSDWVFFGLLSLTWALFAGLTASPAVCRASTFSVTVGADSLVFDKATKDSLLVQFKRHAEGLLSLNDSLSQNWKLDELTRQNVEAGIEGFSELISEIGNEVGDLDLKISDNRISFIDEKGDGIVVRIPDNLEGISQGLKSLTQVILSELPDSIQVDETKIWNWKHLISAPPPPERKVIHGNVIKIGDSLHLTAAEDVRGDVVVVFGNAQISGRVDGDVVVVFGNCQLDESAEVTGQLVTVLGRLDQDDDALVGDTIVVDPRRTGFGGGLLGLVGGGMGFFLLSQVFFFLTAMLSILAVVAAPRKRLYSTLATLQQRPGASLGYGLLITFLGYLSALVLVTVLVLTVIGIPLALVVVLGVGVMMIIATGLAGLGLGSRVCRWVTAECGPLWLQTLLGVTLLHCVCFLGALIGLKTDWSSLGLVVYLSGAMIKGLAVLFGLGALVASRFGKRLVPDSPPLSH